MTECAVIGLIFSQVEFQGSRTMIKRRKKIGGPRPRRNQVLQAENIHEKWGCEQDQRDPTAKDISVMNLPRLDISARSHHKCILTKPHSLRVCRGTKTGTSRGYLGLVSSQVHFDQSSLPTGKSM